MIRICRRARQSGRRSLTWRECRDTRRTARLSGKARSLKKNLAFRLQRTNRGSDKLSFARDFLFSAAAPRAFCVAELLRFLSERHNLSALFLMVSRQPLAVWQQQERRRRLAVKNFLGQEQKIRFSSHYLTAPVLG